MKFATSILIGWGLLASAQLAAQDPPDAARLAAARQVIEASGTVDAMLAGVRAAIPAQRTAMPQVPEEFWTRFDARLADDVPQLADSMAVLYAKTFSLQELEAFVAFHRSPAGQHLRAQQPTLVTTGSAIGQRWGARVGSEIAATLKPQ
jgi:hypothetical protein